MEFIRLTFDTKFNKKYKTDNIKIINSLEIFLSSNFNLNIKSYNLIVPYNKDNMIEIYSSVNNQNIEENIKDFFTPGVKVEILDVVYTIRNKEIIELINNPRLLKGFEQKRVNRYKTVNPIFFKDLFDSFKYIDSKNLIVDELHFKNLFTNHMKSYISNNLNINENEISLNWEEFNVSFLKCDLELKNQICGYGIFSINCQLPFFIGDYTYAGNGKIHSIKTVNTIKKSTVTDIKIKIPFEVLTLMNLNTTDDLKNEIVDFLLKAINDKSASNNNEKKLKNSLLNLNKLGEYR